MRKYKEKAEICPEEESAGSVLEEILREGARKLLQAAIENEVEEFCERHKDNRDEKGHRLAVRSLGTSYIAPIKREKAKAREFGY